MVAFDVTSDLDQVLGDISEGMDTAMAKGVLKGATFAGGAIAKTANTTFDGGTGNLARDFLPARFVSVSGAIGAAAVSDLPYARIQDEGGVIHPKKRYLAIPLTLEAKRQWPRDWPRNDLFVLRAKRSRNLFLAQRMGDKPKFHYVLKKQVTIRGTDYIDRAMADAKDDIDAIMAETMQANIDDAGGA